MSSDDKLEEMLRQAALLEEKMKSSSAGQHQESVNPPVDDMLHQAEVLSQKMCSSRQNMIDSVVDAADDSDASVDEMLRKAELLSRKMISPQSSPPRESSFRKSASESTPGLIRQSERIVSKLPQNQMPNSGDMNTPELMRQTQSLLGKMMASTETGGNGQNGANLAQQKQTCNGNEATRSEELRRLMEQALSSWSGSGEQKGRVKDALLQIVPSLGGSGSIPDTPSTVSVQAPDSDDISSMGSLSPRSKRQSSIQATSLLNSVGRPPLSPSNSQDIDAAEELVRGMAMALQEARSADSQEKQKNVVTPGPHIRRPNEENSSLHNDQPTPPRRGRSDPPTVAASALPNEWNAGYSPRDPPASISKNKPLLPPKEAPSSQQESSVSFTPNRMSSEEAQYNAIMDAIDSSGGGGRVSWEKVESAGAEDDDYVPLADFSKKGGTRSLGVGTFEIPIMMGRSPRVRSRRRKIGRIVVAFVAFVAVGYLMRSWPSSDQVVDTEPTILTKEPVYLEEPDREPFVEPEHEQVADRSDVIVIRGPSPWYNVRKMMAVAARRARRQFLVFVIGLTPPWERFCSADAETCRDTDYLLNMIGPT